MSGALSLVCSRCGKSLPISQGERAEVLGWIVHGAEIKRDELNRFVRDHSGHEFNFDASGMPAADLVEVDGPTAGDT